MSGNTAARQAWRSPSRLSRSCVDLQITDNGDGFEVARTLQDAAQRGRARPRRGQRARAPPGRNVRRAQPGRRPDDRVGHRASLAAARCGGRAGPAARVLSNAAAGSALRGGGLVRNSVRKPHHLREQSRCRRFQSAAIPSPLRPPPARAKSEAPRTGFAASAMEGDREAPQN